MMTTNEVSTVLQPHTMDYLPPPDPKAVEQAMLIGDLSQMSDAQRISYYVATCRSLNLNPLTHPFMALKGDDGKISLYPDKGCAEQLRKLHRVSCKVIGREILNDLYIVTVRATTPDGREEESQGIVPLAKAKGTWQETTGGKRYFKTAVDSDGREIMVPLSASERATAMMRAESKGKRRVTLAICGLGMPDWEHEPGQASHPMALTLQTPPQGEAGATLAQAIADLSEPVNPTAPPARQSTGVENPVDYLLRIETLVADQHGDLDQWRTWAEGQYGKPQDQFTVADYARWLEAVQVVAKRGPRKKGPQTAQDAPGATQTPAPISGDSAPPGGPSAGQETAQTYSVDPETGVLLDKDGKPLPNLMAEEDEPGLFGGDN